MGYGMSPLGLWGGLWDMGYGLWDEPLATQGEIKREDETGAPDEQVPVMEIAYPKECTDSSLLAE